MVSSRFWTRAICAVVLSLATLLAGAGRAEGGMLRIKNSTPFLMQIYIARVRVGWIKPFRTETFKGLKDGGHKLYAHSEYGSAAWGPRAIQSPGQVNLTLDRAVIEEATAALASRIYKTNRATLVACDRLAERRGENSQGGRVELECQVGEKGSGTVGVKGEDGMSEKLLSCYRAVTKQWTFPETGAEYTISLTHVQ